MPLLALDNTLSGQYSNSYCDVDFADEYFENHWISTYATAWDALEDGQKERALIAACRVIETARFTERTSLSDYAYLYDYESGNIISIDANHEPVRYAYTQGLQFPRNLDLDATTGDTFVPETILQAQCEQAIYLLTLDPTILANRLLGLKKDAVSIGKGQIATRQEYTEGGNVSSFAPMAVELCRPLFLRSGTKVRRG